MFTKTSAVLALLGCALLAGLPARSATVFETTELAGATAAVDATLPEPQVFQVADAGSYTISLADLRTPVDLQSLQAIVTRDLKVVAQVSVTYPAAPAAPDVASMNFNATAGTYRVHVLAIPKAGEAGGLFSVKVAPAAGGAALLDHADAVASPSGPGPGQSALQTTFTITQAGNYDLSITDDAFPVPLASAPQVLLLREADSFPVLMAPGQFTVAGPGDYQLVVIATAGGAALSGLYSVRVTSGPIIAYQSVQPVGNMAPPTPVTIATADQYTMTLADANFPAALGSLAVRLAQGDSIIGSLDAANSVAVNAAAGTAQLFAVATPAAAEGVGAYKVQLTNAQQTVFADVRTVDDSPDPTTPAIYAFSPSAAIAAGNYQLKLEDLAFPNSFASLKAAVTQGGTVAGTANTPGSNTFTLQSGPVKVLVAAKPPAAGGNALFGLTLSLAAAGSPNLIESTQGVGGLFRTDTVSITTAGPYDLSLSDLEFPARMATAQLAVTRGTTLIAQIVGGGTVARQQLTAGTYVLNFLGQPASAAQYGTYGLQVAESAPQPTVTLTATPANITAGQTTKLDWSSSNATTCSASNGWSGAKKATDSETVGPLNANTTFALSCTGPGGTGTASVTVNVSAPSANGGGGGGGGAFGIGLLAALGVLLAWQRRCLPLSR